MQFCIVLNTQLPELWCPIGIEHSDNPFKFDDIYNTKLFYSTKAVIKIEIGLAVLIFEQPPKNFKINTTLR